MAYYRRVGTVTRDLLETEHTFHMYMFQVADGATGANEKGVLPTLVIVALKPGILFGDIDVFGRAVAVDWDIRDGPDAATSTIVARGRGSAMGDIMKKNGYFLSLDILFTDERFKGSTLTVLGSYENVPEDGADHLAIVGGTGEFAYAQGTISYKALTLDSAQIIREVNIRVFCRNVPPPTPLLNKEGSFGGPGGADFDIPAADLPQHITSITIRSDGAINSLAYTYIDQAGNEKTAGPWGGSGGILRPTIYFPPGETLKEVIGSTGIFDNIEIVTSLTIVTSKGKTYKYGTPSVSQFSIPDQDTNEVVGFFGCSGIYLDALGGYTTLAAPTN